MPDWATTSVTDAKLPPDQKLPLASAHAHKHEIAINSGLKVDRVFLQIKIHDLRLDLPYKSNQLFLNKNRYLWVICHHFFFI